MTESLFYALSVKMVSSISAGDYRKAYNLLQEIEEHLLVKLETEDKITKELQ